MIKRVDYNAVAGTYDRRYERSDYNGVRQTVVGFVSSGPRADVLEVGCGTGHWLAVLADPNARKVAGIDRSREMLRRARVAAPDSDLVEGRAEQLPFSSATFNRVFCINALHHFEHHVAFFEEARTVLRAGGGLLVVGIDPHVGTDRWWIYDYFPEARETDRKRYPPATAIRDAMLKVGFTQCATGEAQHFSAEMTVEEASDRGHLERTATSQLMVISDEEYERGWAAIHAAEPKSMLRTDVRLYATSGWIEPAATNVDA